MFGIENTEKFLNVFAGMTVRVPSTREMEEEERNLAIYHTLRTGTSASHSRRMGTILCERYRLKRKELRKIYWETKRKLKEANKFRESESLVSELKSKRRK
jgi:hypothetical protein